MEEQEVRGWGFLGFGGRQRGAGMGQGAGIGEGHVFLRSAHRRAGVGLKERVLKHVEWAGHGYIICLPVSGCDGVGAGETVDCFRQGVQGAAGEEKNVGGSEELRVEGQRGWQA